MVVYIPAAKREQRPIHMGEDMFQDPFIRVELKK